MQLFETDHLKRDMKRRAVRGTAATFASRGVVLVAETAGTMLLARLLMPGDFGLVAMVVVVVNLVALLRDVGLSEATVWAEKMSHDLANTLFWLTFGMGVVLAAIVAALAPVMAWFYGEPRLVGITLGLVPGLILSSSMMQHRALLRRQMRFGRVAAVQSVSVTCSVTVGVLAAWMGLGVWALVLQRVAGSLFPAIGMWIACPWKPGRPAFCRDAWQSVKFGGTLMANRLLTYGMRNVDNLLVGRFVGSRGLGLYVKAYSLLLMPLMHVNQPLSTVVVPALSRLRNEPERFLAYYRRALSLVAMTTLPVALFAAVAARQIIGVVLGPRWEASADIFALLSPAAACASLGVATGWVYMAFGHLDRQLRVRLVTSALGLAAMCVGVRWGVRGMAVAVSTAALVFQWPQLMICYRGTPVSVRELFAAVAMPAGAALLAAAAVLGVAAAAGLDGTGLKELAVKTAVFGGVYALPFAATRGGRQRLRMLYDALRVLR